jgi:hypothetical protein
MLHELQAEGISIIVSIHPTGRSGTVR